MERPLKTRSELMGELRTLRRQVANLEAALAQAAPVAQGACLSNDAPQQDASARSRVNGQAALVSGTAPKHPASEIWDRWPTEGLADYLLASTQGFFFRLDRRGIVRACEGSGVTAFGLTPEEAIGRHYADVLDDFTNPEGGAAILRQALGGQDARGPLVTEDGAAFELCCRPLLDDSGQVMGAVALGVDVTGLTGLWQTTRPDAADPSSAEELLRWHEQDRRLIAYEIHDGFVQDATGAMMQLDALLDSGRIAEGRGRQEVDVALRLIRKAVAEARRLICGLRPPILEELGVVSAIEYLVDDQPPGGPSIDLCVDVQFARLEPLLEGTIYRIVQEAITNVRRHSGSDRAEVRLTQEGDRLKMEVRDWGVGFDPNGIQGTRFGLRGISERARLLCGRARIDSSPGKGTRVLVDLPLARPLGKSQLHDRSSEWTKSKY